MDHVSYTNGKHTYSIVPITDDSFIDSDMIKVDHLLGGMNRVKYREAMVDSINQGLAYSVYEDDKRKGFVYNRVYKGAYYGASINIEGTIPLMIALRSMFDGVPYRKIAFVPHKDNFKYFKSMIAGDKIRAYHSGIPTITISKEKLTAQGYRLFKYFDIRRV